MTTKQDIEKVLWNACDSFRGKMNSSLYMEYILPMLFVKYLSDVYAETKAKYEVQYKGDATRVERAMSRERFVMDDKSTFDYLYANKNDAQIGQKINMALAAIENNNSAKLHGVFRAIDFNSSINFGEVKEKNATLKNLLEDIQQLDLRPSQISDADIIGDAYEYMIAFFASDAGKKGGEFYTPSEVSELVARLVKPKENDRIYDGTCGSGGLLLKGFKQVPSKKISIYGQEQNMQTWALCRMNMFLHGVDNAVIWQGDTLANPGNIENDRLMKFQCIVANPPFSLDKWDSGFLGEVAEGDKKAKMTPELDPYKRFDWGIPPTSKGDYAFVMHFLHSLDDATGRMGIVLPHGVLFRGASEGKIRQTIIEKFNFLDAVIGLPANLFYGASIPACILIFRKNRGASNHVLFVDASGDGHFEKGKNQNVLRKEDIEKIVETYNTYLSDPSFGGEEKYSHVATLEEIKGNDYNLNIPRYVDTFEEEEMIDIEEVKTNIKNIESELSKVQAQMAKYMNELGL
ncbi:type I restriction enzyme M protein [Fibrobacter sp. UWH9]|uniref:type I restriction-modification system subunit M n=1 Tax=Fibrobacter sp. UWH9 TaxID=1896213 RepID=UPI000913C215|nr:type I restriction-modification system subunit M [Fibrobacter sp. UWH9]SHH70514.1 type I restriction enzyme M protein [Fibrobacter sp. UWH9]